MDWDTSDAEAPDPPLSSRASCRDLHLFAGGLLVGVQVVGRVDEASFTAVAVPLGVDLVGSDPDFVTCAVFAGALANTGLAGFCEPKVFD